MRPDKRPCRRGTSTEVHVSSNVALEGEVGFILVRSALGDGQKLRLEGSSGTLSQRSFEDLAMFRFDRSTMLRSALSQRSDQIIVESSSEQLSHAFIDTWLASAGKRGGS